MNHKYMPLTLIALPLVVVIINSFLLNQGNVFLLVDLSLESSQVDQYVFFLIHVISSFGSLITAGLIALSLLLTDFRKAKTYVLMVIMIYILTLSLKTMTAIERPQSDFVGNSYPSLHTAIAFTNASIIVKLFKTDKFYVVVFLIASTVGLARMLLGAHYLNDVVAGLLIGLAINSICTKYCLAE